MFAAFSALRSYQLKLKSVSNKFEGGWRDYLLHNQDNNDIFSWEHEKSFTRYFPLHATDESEVFGSIQCSRTRTSKFPEVNLIDRNLDCQMHHKKKKRKKHASDKQMFDLHIFFEHNQN